MDELDKLNEKKKKKKETSEKRTTTMTFLLDKNAVTKLAKEAEKQRRNLSNLVQYILIEYVEKIKKGEI